MAASFSRRHHTHGRVQRQLQPFLQDELINNKEVIATYEYVAILAASTQGCHGTHQPHPASSWQDKTPGVQGGTTTAWGYYGCCTHYCHHSCCCLPQAGHRVSDSATNFIPTVSDSHQVLKRWRTARGRGAKCLETCSWSHLKLYRQSNCNLNSKGTLFRTIYGFRRIFHETHP